MTSYKPPHPLDRPGQAEALQWILESDKKYLILCAPTGFGKSPLAAYTSIDYKTMALVLHKSLQSANYKDQYQFDILYGKRNYPCLERPKQLSLNGFSKLSFTAFDCSNPHCECPYQAQERLCMESMRTSLNYAKFLMSRPFIDTLNLDYLFLDEAHNLPDIVTEFVGFSVNWDNEFIQCNGGVKPTNLLGDELSVQINYNEAMVIFRQIARAVSENKPDRENDLVRWRKWKRINQKVAITNKILSDSLNDWYYEISRRGLSIKPLTAKYHFKRFFGVAKKVVLMSATIKPTIAERLGIEADEFDFMDIPNPWPTPLRLVHDLGGPAMNYKSDEEDKNKNAHLIASVLSPDLSGVIHVASKRQAYELQDRLYAITDIEHPLGSIEFVLPIENKSTDYQINEWYSLRRNGCYCIAWAFHEGVDLGEDAINIVAKVPYPSLGSGYEQAKKNYDPQWYLEKTAYRVQQICGRTRRGKPEHYENGGRQVYICDSAYHRLKTLFPRDFRNSIRRMK